MTATYATTLELARFINIEGTIPDRNATGSSRAKENVGTGDNSTLLFYADKAYIINGSYAFYYGPTEASATALTETTHYSLNKDNGTITLTTAGRTLLGTQYIYGGYSYNTLEFTDTMLQETLDRAQAEIDDRTNNHWADGTAATPDFTQVTNEKHTGKGKYDRDYYLDNFPLPNIYTSTSAASVGATSLTLGSSNGFLSSGIVGVNNNRIEYAGKDTVQHILLGCNGITNAITAGATAVPYVVEISTTDSGTTPTWTILDKDDDYDIDLDTGKVHLYVTDYDMTYYALQYPPKNIPNRFRTTYVWGTDTIPNDVKRLTLMLATKDLLHAVMRRSILHGTSMSKMESINVDDEWIESTMERLSSKQMYQN